MTSSWLLLIFLRFSRKINKYGSTFLECAENYTQTDNGGKFIHLLEEKQDEAVHRIRDTIQYLGGERGLPEPGVVSNICSFTLPRIRSPVEDEIAWEQPVVDAEADEDVNENCGGTEEDKEDDFTISGGVADSVTDDVLGEFDGNDLDDN